MRPDLGLDLRLAWSLSSTASSSSRLRGKAANSFSMSSFEGCPVQEKIQFCFLYWAQKIAALISLQIRDPALLVNAHSDPVPNILKICTLHKVLKFY